MNVDLLGFIGIIAYFCHATFQEGVSLRQSCKITFAFISKELADAIIGAVKDSPRKNTS